MMCTYIVENYLTFLTIQQSDELHTKPPPERETSASNTSRIYDLTDPVPKALQHRQRQVQSKPQSCVASRTTNPTLQPFTRVTILPLLSSPSETYEHNPPNPTQTPTPIFLLTTQPFDYGTAIQPNLFKRYSELVLLSRDRDSNPRDPAPSVDSFHHPHPHSP
jgi:hypothetical protein